MSLVDPISDMLTRIRNAYAVGKDELSMPKSTVKAAILAILKEKGYIEDYSENGNLLNIKLRYEGQQPAVKSIKRVSKPGRRIYVAKDKIPTVLSGHGIAVVSTSKGIMTGDVAKRENLGGELICEVY